MSHSIRTTLTIEVEVDIEYNYVPSTPERRPAYSHGGLPAEPAEIEFVDAMVVQDGKAVIAEAAAEWLADAGYDKAVETAEEGE